jgi:dihydrofolate reductase
VKQALAAGLLDELQIHLVPILLGDGVRMFDPAESGQLDLERTQLAGPNGVTHLRYRVGNRG